ncbi:MAG: nitrate reductase molybdenum cofactor assembly chaperone [Halodesulfurarchaeum sp.]
MAGTDAAAGTEPRDRSGRREALAEAYELIATSFVYPEDLDTERFRRRAAEEALPRVARELDPQVAAELSAFVDVLGDIDPDEYVSTFELSPRCPLYLGHYAFDPPETCRDIGDADRNQYMVELAGIYEHFGWGLEDELPDYLPAMSEFLALTVDERDSELRAEFLEKLLGFLPDARERFEDVGTPYRYPLRAFEQVAKLDLEGIEGGSPGSAEGFPDPGAHTSKGGEP